MVTSEEFTEICHTMAMCIGKQLVHIETNTKVEYVAFPVDNAFIQLEGDKRISYENYHEYQKDFESVKKALSAFGYTITRNLFDDKKSKSNPWDNIADKIQDAFSDPLEFAQQYMGKFEHSNCLHKQCPECGGTGTKINGGTCIHGISCPCPNCSPR